PGAATASSLPVTRVSDTVEGRGGLTGKRPGICPPDPVQCAHSALAHCSSDPECPGEQKCCYIACRFRCVDPPDTPPSQIPPRTGCSRLRT
uniref:WAP domain-containing protein n=1 Tax=Terrapene triunguis TaxID=2587831 RepID=A0A674IXY7_9SAUR